MLSDSFKYITVNKKLSVFYTLKIGGYIMAKFLDYHAKMPQMPPEAVKAVQADIKAGRPDTFGVKPLNAFVSKGGMGWCFTEAPSADAVCKSHEAKGIKLGKGEVHEVMSYV